MTGVKTAALNGMRVLDMTQYEAGTSATQMLAWLGADIVKVESPAGDPGRKVFTTGSDDSQYFFNYNSNKRSIVLDLKQSRGRDLLLDLVPKFDVFVENFGPGVIERLDLGYDILRERNPALIYVRIKGYGLSGPYSGWKCFDPLAQAASGAVSVTGHADGPPIKPGPTFADTGTGMQTALAITAAWVQRLQTGVGQEIELSMQEVMTMFMRTTGVSYWADEVVPRQGHSAGAPSGMYPCAPADVGSDGGPDGGSDGSNDYVHMLVATSRMWDQLCVVSGREDLLVDPRFETARARSENAEALDTEIRAWTTQYTKHDAMRILCDAGVAASAIFDTMDVFHDPHLAERGFIETVQHPAEGEITLMKSPIRMSESEVPLEPAPIFGANTEEILTGELGLSAEEVEALNASGVVHSRPGLAFEASVEK